VRNTINKAPGPDGERFEVLGSDPLQHYMQCNEDEERNGEYSYQNLLPSDETASSPPTHIAHEMSHITNVPGSTLMSHGILSKTWSVEKMV
jgi:hypothetical protein